MLQLTFHNTFTEFCDVTKENTRVCWSVAKISTDSNLQFCCLISKNKMHSTAWAKNRAIINGLFFFIDYCCLFFPHPALWILFFEILKRNCKIRISWNFASIWHKIRACQWLSAHSGQFSTCIVTAGYHKTHHSKKN